MKKLETLPVEQLQPGMQIASPVADDSGRMLLPAGAELTEATIAGLQRRGIAQVSVELEVEDDPAELERHRQQVTARLERLFRRAGQGKETLALYQAITKFRMEQRS